MPSGRLGKKALPQDNDWKLYTVPAATVTTATVSMVNRGSADAFVRLAVSDVDAPAADDYMEYDYKLPGGGVLERTGIVCSAGERIIVRANTGFVSARAHGFEEAA